MPFAYLRSPADDRRAHSPYGVPITYGCEALIDDVHECMKQVADEFRLKQVRVFADSRLFGRKGAGRPSDLDEKLFMQLPGAFSDKPLIETFSPEIRDAAQFNRLDRMFSLLEKAVGTSAGILSEPRSRSQGGAGHATATEIKAAMYDTFATVDCIRRAVEAGMEEYLRACEMVLGCGEEARLTFDWSHALLESSGETFDQLMRGLEKDVVTKEEVRAWLMP
jgi:hypothetical protein